MKSNRILYCSTISVCVIFYSRRQQALSQRASKKCDEWERLLSVAGELKGRINEEVSSKSPVVYNGISIWRTNRGSPQYPVQRILKTSINAPIDVVEDYWTNIENRKLWDTVWLSDSQKVSEINENVSLGYVRCKPGYFSSARDFSFFFSKIPGNAVGCNNIFSRAIVTADASAHIQTSSWAVRGSLNSLLILEPKGPKVTMATWIIEYSINGWIPLLLADMYADRIAISLNALKSVAEYDEALENTTDIDEVALRRFNKQQIRKNQISSIVSDANAMNEDLQDTLHLLEKKLSDVIVEERLTGLDFSVLKQRIESDINQIRQRIN